MTDDAVPACPHEGYRQLAGALLAAGIAPADPERQPLTAARAAAEAYYAFLSRGPNPIVETTDHHVAGPSGRCLLRLYRPTGPTEGNLPLLLYAHGGGYVLNGVATHDALMRHIADQSGAAVCALGYGKAPEHRYPAQLHDALHALTWFADRADRLRLDPTRILLAGDSAGAHLALSTALALEHDGKPRPRGLVLAYGMYDPGLGGASFREFREGYGLTTARMRWFWDQTLAPGQDRSDPAVCPLNARLNDLPPALILTAGLDCLRDDSLALAHRLAKTNGRHRLAFYPDMQHSFLLAPAWLPPARQAITEIAAFVRDKLGD